jgi:ribosomal-protein-serine acetyltransferase
MFIIDERTALRPLALDDAGELFALTDANRAYLRRWLPWVDAVTSVAHTREFIETVVEQRESGRGPVFAIVHGAALIGTIGFRPIDRLNCVGEIGYWLAAAAQGSGIMTGCCRFVVRYGFYTLDLHRIQIAAAVDNLRSRAIPERLGFRLEGVLRGRENRDGVFIDHAMYALLRPDLPADF